MARLALCVCCREVFDRDTGEVAKWATPEQVPAADHGGVCLGCKRYFEDRKGWRTTTDVKEAP